MCPSIVNILVREPKHSLVWTIFANNSLRTKANVYSTKQTMKNELKYIRIHIENHYCLQSPTPNSPIINSKSKENITSSEKKKD